MQIKIPRRIVQAADRFGDIVNVPLINIGCFEIVRLDMILAIGFVVAVVYYWLIGGWVLALEGAVLYGFFFLVGGLLRGRSEEESKKNKEIESWRFNLKIHGENKK